MRKIVLIVFAVLLSIVSPVSTFAASDEQTSESISKVYEPSGNPNAKVTFIDKNLLGSSISPQAGERRVYKYSYYQVASQQITAYNVGPREKDKFLISVSKGVTKTITGTISIAASVTYSASVSADIAKVVNASLTGEVSGSMSYEWSKSTAYSGPTGNFTTRDYYGAINYDKYNNVVKKYDVYDLYLGSVHEGTSTELSSTINVNAVKKPKVVEYYRDHNN